MGESITNCPGSSWLPIAIRQALGSQVSRAGPLPKGRILTLLSIELPDWVPVLVTAGEVEGHEATATGFGPELAAALEPALQLGAEGFHRAAAHGTAFGGARRILNVVAMDWMRELSHTCSYRADFPIPNQMYPAGNKFFILKIKPTEESFVRLAGPTWLAHVA